MSRSGPLSPVWSSSSRRRPARTSSRASRSGRLLRPLVPEAWKQQGFDPFTKYHPALGFYDSSSTAVIQPDSEHQYSPAFARVDQAGYSLVISPGFNKRSEATPRLSRDLARWVTDVAAMKPSGEPWQLVTTFSEWGEGTMVEASTEFGTTYLDVLATGLR